MKSIPLCLLLVLGWATVGTGQSPITPRPPDDSRSPIRPASRAGEYHVIVEGCVNGTHLTRLEGVPDLAGDYLQATEWSLEGPREVVQRIRTSLQGYHVEVTGIVVLPQSLEGRAADVDSRRLPNGTRVTFGARRSSSERTPRGPEGPATAVRLDVRTIDVKAERCG